MSIEEILLYISFGITGINTIGSVLIYLRYVSFLSGVVSIVTADETGEVFVMDDLGPGRKGIWKRMLFR